MGVNSYVIIKNIFLRILFYLQSKILFVQGWSYYIHNVKNSLGRLRDDSVNDFCSFMTAARNFNYPLCW